MLRSRWSRVTALGVVAAVALLGLAGCTKYGAPIDRPEDPVVMTGNQLPKLLGTDPYHVVGFSWDGSAWHQVPVQADERDYVSPGQIYNWPTSIWPTLYGTSTPYKMLVYTPPPSAEPGYTSYATYTPPASDPTLDALDQISFLSDDTGKQAPDSAGDPPGVTASTREQVQATDPLGTGSGYVYLYHSDSLTGGSAGGDGVTYTFSLDSGSYTATYKMGTSSNPPNNTWGFNPEHSTVDAPGYTQTMSDRWLGNGLSDKITTAPAANWLDRSKYFVVNAGCVRTEDTFDGLASGEGAFVANISGPVRAIRSYMGANSYKYTVNTDIFYPQREDTTTELRGHAGLPGFASVDDFATGLAGLTYSDPANSGIPIDGVPDAVTPISASTPNALPPAWQMVQGAPGSLVTVRNLVTSITGLQVSTVYQDQRSPSVPPCTGDGSYWGQNGFQVVAPGGSVPITDPTLSSTPGTFTAYRYRFFELPGFTASQASNVNARALNPIQTTVSG